MGADLTAVVLAKDNEKTIGPCLDRLKWVDELVVIVDSDSTDETVAEARKHTERVHINPFFNYSQQRNFGLSKVRTKWVLFNDSDEEVSAELQYEIKAELPQSRFCGYWIPHLNYVLGRPVYHGGWYPDHQLKLFIRNGARFTNRIHELPQFQGEIGFLAGHMIHRSFESLRQRIRKLINYSDVRAIDIFEQEGPASYIHAVRELLLENKQRLLDQKAYLDGWRGFVYTYFSAAETFLSHIKTNRYR